MLFNSFSYLVFLPFVVILYFLLPAKARNTWLLLASLFFYGCWKAEYLALILISIGVTYLCGVLIGIARDKKAENIRLRRLILLASLVINLSILFFFKYFNFTASVINSIMRHESVPLLDILLPVGISFYTFQAIGYTIDVFRGTIKPERNIVKYATFICFFPQLVAGPIERASNLLPQFSEKHSFDFDRTVEGLLLIVWGFFMKLVISDRVAMFVNDVYDNVDGQPGYMLAIAAVLFSFQIYCDFGAYSNIAIGSAKILGFNLMKNFNAPFLATSVGDFWDRWHISLTTWFRDYLYIPLGGNRKGFSRKLINILIIFLVSGLWHGANWTFIAWGLVHGLLLVLSNITAPVRKKIREKLKINTKNFFYRLYCTLQTFVLVCLAFVFFRANSISNALYAIKQMFTHFRGVGFSTDVLFSAGLDEKDFIVAIIAIAVLTAVELVSQKKDVIPSIVSKKLPLRWAIYILLVCAIVIFGVWGPAYDATPFIYFQF